MCGLVSGPARLLTLTGPGGIGKSRLAIEVAARCETAFRDGAWFVDLSGVRDPALVAPTVAHALGIREAAGALPVASLKSYLASMQALILLDSFENVTAAAPLVLDLLASAPGVHVLRHEPQRAAGARRAGVPAAAAAAPPSPAPPTRRPARRSSSSSSAPPRPTRTAR